MSREISHNGVVAEISNDQVRVKFTCYSACAGCHARGVCGLADTRDKEVVVPRRSLNLHAGDPVKIQMQQSMGFRALFLGYVLPFLIVLLALIILISTGTGEVMAGLISLVLLVPYYSGLYLFRQRIDRSFSFILKKEEKEKA